MGERWKDLPSDMLDSDDMEIIGKGSGRLTIFYDEVYEETDFTLNITLALKEVRRCREMDASELVAELPRLGVSSDFATKEYANESRVAMTLLTYLSPKKLVIPGIRTVANKEDLPNAFAIGEIFYTDKERTFYYWNGSWEVISGACVHIESEACAHMESEANEGGKH